MENVVSNLKNNAIKPSKKTNHYLWIDIAKGLGIFLICYGHTLYEVSNPVLNQLLYSFHVPFFFVLSGFVFSVKKDENFLTFLKKKALRILVPLTVFVFCGLLTAIFMADVKDPIVLLRYFFYYDGTYYFNMPCWFFISLFFIYVISYLIKLNLRKWWVKLIMMVSFFVGGFLIYRQMPYIDPEVNPFLKFGIDKTIIVTGFFIFGSLLKDVHNQVKFSKQTCYLFPILIVSITLLVIFGIELNPKTSLYNRILNNYWYFIASGISGSVTFLIFSIYLTQVKFLIPVLKAWGGHTIFIAGTHYLYTAMGTIFTMIFQNFGFVGTYKMDLFAPVWVIAILLVYIPLGFLVDRYLPFVSGVEPYFYIELRRRKLESNR